MCSCCSVEIHVPLPKWTKLSHARLSLNMANGAMDFYVFILVQCFWHFASRLESQHIFSTFCRLEKEATGPEQGLYAPPHTETHTHISNETCTLGWPQHGVFPMWTFLKIQCCLVSSSIFFPTIFLSPRSQISLQNNQKKGHRCFWGREMVDIHVMMMMSLLLWLLTSCLREMCDCWRKTLSATMTRRKELPRECDKHINSVQTSGPLCESEWVAELSALPHSKGPVGKWMGLISWEGPAQPD